MTRKFVASLLLALGLTVGAVGAQAEESQPLLSSGANIHDQASLQRGAKLFMNYCSGCHSLHFLRYARISKDLGLTEGEVMKNLNFTGGQFEGPVVAAMSSKEAEGFFGKAPPDLSLIVDQKGGDWVYTYLNSFYMDGKTATGWNNTLFPNVAMPNILWELQGIQMPVHAKGDDGAITGVKLTKAGTMTPSQFHAATRDITAFLTYASDPSALTRHAMAPWVLLYLVILTFLFWLLKHEYWKDVEH